MQVRESIRTPSRTPQFKPSTINGEGEVELFLGQFMDIAAEKEWTDYSTLLHLNGCFEGPAKSHGRGDSLDTIISNIQIRYGTSAQRAKERLLGLRKDPKRSVLDYAEEVVKLVSLAHHYLPATEKDALLSTT